MNSVTLGIDLGKRWFHVVGCDAAGKVVLREKLGRHQLLQLMAQHPPCLVGIETCCGSQYLARKFQGFGHDVKLIPAQFVKPYLKSNKALYNVIVLGGGFDLTGKCDDALVDAQEIRPQIRQ